MVNLYAKYENPNNGTDYDKKEAKELFVVNQFYKVENVDMGQSHTSITLKGINGSFNSVMFEFYELINDEFVKYDIFADPDYNPYIKRKTYTFTAVDGKERTFNIGDLVINSGGRIGKITHICTCSQCKERGFYEPSAEMYDIDETTDYISLYTFKDNFRSYYKIGDEVFSEKPSKDNIIACISEIDDKIRTLEFYKQEYNKVIDDLYKGE